MILADGELFCCFVVGLGLPPLTYVVGSAFKGERFAKSGWLLVALIFVVLDLVIITLSSTSEREMSYRLLGFKREYLPSLIVGGSAVGILVSFAMCTAIGKGIGPIPYDNGDENRDSADAGRQEAQTPAAAGDREHADVKEADESSRK